jgi:ABC-type amino acid transport substrate-binding protein
VQFFVRSCLLASCLPFTVHAQTYVVGVEKAEFMPYSRVDDQGRYSGYARELLDSFATSAGITLEYRPLAPADLLAALLSGEVDFKYPDNSLWGAAAKTDKNLSYSASTVDYIDGVLVLPLQKGKSIQQLKRLAVVDGWSPQEYSAPINAGQMTQVGSTDLTTLIRSVIKKQADGAYYNVEVALYALNNSYKQTNALLFDANLPYSRGSYHLSTLRHGAVLKRFDQFLQQQSAQVLALKSKHRVEENINSEFLGLEQWKVDFIKRQRAKEQAAKAG